MELQLQVSTPFHFVVYGDSRFHDPKDTEAANPPVRQALVQAIAQASPAFISFGGDIVYNGYDADDWKVWDSETAVWRTNKIRFTPLWATTIFTAMKRLRLPTISSAFLI